MLTDDDRGGKLVLPERNVPPGRQFALRAGVALGCIFVASALVYLGRSGYRDVTGDPLTPLDALYYATVSLSTTGYGDITPITPEARLVNILIITPLRLLFLIVLVGTTIEVLTQRTREQSRERAWRKKVQHHSVVIGYGVKGRAAVATLLQAGERVDRIVGSYPSYHPRGIDAAAAAARIFNALGIDFAVLGKEEKDDADSQRLAGEKGLFEVMAESNIATFNNYEWKEMVVTGQDDFFV